MSPYSVCLLLLFSAISLISSSNIIIENNCLRLIYVYQHGYFGNDTFECIIPRDGACELNYDDDFVGFKVRQKKDDEPKSLTEISINQFHSGTDYYGINLSRGFDFWASIEPLAENATRITCRDIAMCQVFSHLGAEPTKELKIQDGKIQGVIYTFDDGKKGSGYMSIPYAKPPVGELRFKKPESPEPWSNVRDCSKLPPICPHYDMYHEKVTVNIPKSEDCLYLNVFTPGVVEEGKKNLPVMLYIHGGAFVVHSASHMGDKNICR